MCVSRETEIKFHAPAGDMHLNRAQNVTDSADGSQGFILQIPREAKRDEEDCNNFFLPILTEC